MLMFRFVLLTALATTVQSVAFAQTPAAQVPPTPPSVAAPAPPAAPQTPRPSRQGVPAPTPPTPPEGIPRALVGQTFSGSPTNVRLELVLTDTYSGSPVKKTVSMIVVLGQNGMIRSSSNVGNSTVELNVDAMARYWANPIPFSAGFARPGGGGRGGRGSVSGQTATTTPPATTPITNAETGDGQRPILLNLTLQYSPAAASTGPRPAALNQSLSVIVQDGKPLLVSQSAD